MIVAILIGRRESKGFPGKNTALIGGRPLLAYPLMAALAVTDIDQIIVCTDDETIGEYVRATNMPPLLGGRVSVIGRPRYLCTDEAQAGEVYQFAYDDVRIQDTSTRKDIELLVLLMCNAPMITPVQIQQGIAALRDDPTLDSAITVSAYNMFSPARARYLDTQGLLRPMVQLQGATCDRNSTGDVWFCDFGAVIVRPRCLEKLDGLPPQTWMGHRIYPLKQWGGFDVDYDWQVPHVEHWLKKHGLS